MGILNMHNIYIQFDKDNNFAGFNLQMLEEREKYNIVINKETKAESQEPDGYEIVALDPLPENAFVITAQQHEEYLTALSSQLKDIVLIDGNIEIKVLEVVNGSVKLGIIAPKEVQVHRKEVYDKIKLENKESASGLKSIRKLIESKQEK